MAHEFSHAANFYTEGSHMQAAAAELDKVQEKYARMTFDAAAKGMQKSRKSPDLQKSRGLRLFLSRAVDGT